MDIRGTRLRKPSDEALAFTSSMADDGRIARQVISVNIAHMAALVRAGEVDRRVGAKCMSFLAGASPKISPRAKSEDFHQQLEQEAVDLLGVETAGFLNYGKSRNDQVATAIRMELRGSILVLLGSILELQVALLEQAKRDGGVLVPGYTHLQRAQPTTFAHHLFAHFDALQRDVERALQLYQRVNQSPMGSAAMAGTSVNVDRRYVAGLLGFSGLVRNAMDGVSSRDVAVEALSCATITALDASRLAEELILWSSSEFGYIELSDAYAASSSIMPQKKNAVAAEMARAKAGSVLGGLVAACAILKALPYAYNLDLQEVTPHLWRAMDDVTSTVRVLAGMVASASPKKERLALAVRGDGSTAVGLANHLVKEHGFSFRQAHVMVGELVRISAETGAPLHEVAASKLAAVSASLGKKVTMEGEAIESILDPARFLGEVATEGGANPRLITKELKAREGDVASTRSTLAERKAALAAAERKLRTATLGLAREVKLRE